MKTLDPKSTNILIVGLGLLGGCYARALTEHGFAVRAITLEQSSIDYAVSHGFLAGGSTEPDATLIAQADLIVFALYPHVFIEWIERYQHLFAPGTVLTDVTGVKGNVVSRIQSILSGYSGAFRGIYRTKVRSLSYRRRTIRNNGYRKPRRESEGRDRPSYTSKLPQLSSDVSYPSRGTYR